MLNQPIPETNPSSHRPPRTFNDCWGIPYLNQTITYSSSSGLFSEIATTRSGQTGTLTNTYSYVTNSSLVDHYSCGNFTLSRTYEASRDLVLEVKSKWNTTSLTCYDAVYNALQQRSSVMQSGTAFADIENSTYYRESYDDRGQLQTATGYLGTNPGITTAPLPGRNFAYGYDAIGNRTSVSWTGSSGSADVYTPNSLNQYDSRQNHYVNAAGTVASDSVSVTANGGTNSPTVQTRGNYWFTQLTFDNASQPKQGTINITALLAGNPNVAGTQSVTAQIPSASQSFTYDADGNLLTDGKWTYQWDAENRLTQMSTSTAAVNAGIAGQILTFQYDYLDRRVQKRVTNTAGTQEFYSRRYLYDGWNLVAELAAPGGNTCGTIVRSYTWGLDLSGSESAAGGVGALLQIADYATGKNYLPTYDTDGNVAALVNASNGTVAIAYEYSPYGELLRKTVTDSDIADSVFQFSSKFTDKESSLVYYGHRYYGPSLGRFLNRDPIEEAGGLNLYGFCGNDGISAFDVNGNSWLSKLWDHTILSLGKHIAQNWDHGRSYVEMGAAIVASVFVGWEVAGWAETELTAMDYGLTYAQASFMIATNSAAASTIGVIGGGDCWGSSRRICQRNFTGCHKWATSRPSAPVGIERRGIWSLARRNYRGDRSSEQRSRLPDPARAGS